MIARCLVACSLLALSSLACQSKAAPPTDTAASAEAAASPPPAPSAAATPAHQKFGAPFGASPTVALADVIKTPEKFADQTVQVEGAVRAACTRKGCWMELSEAQDPAAAGCRVTFKDYGFFVPTDSAGSQARVEAKVETKLIKPELVAHLESEGAKFAEKSADGSAQEVRLIATSVEMWR
ncbi:MAG TPA: DUF4920 domain-containing protein [Polyangiaceae bacterium]|nr:DUF4920 domain-containing protein [Polyangiaceae bacterium]